MKIKSMTRGDWQRLYRKQVSIYDFQYRERKGKIALLTIQELRAPLVISYGTRRVKLADVGYTWLQMAFEGEYFWVTAMFDENDELKEIYVDMTDGNILTAEDPYFRDMYLDYVILQGDILELDMDELEEAYDYGEISKEQYERTLSEGEKVWEYLTRNAGKLTELVKKEQKRLKAMQQGADQ